MVQQKAYENAQQVWLASSDEIPKLLKDRRLDQLEGVLDQAVQAGYRLGKHDSEWRLLQNLRDETFAVNRIAHADLVTAFQNAYDSDGILRQNAGETVSRATDAGIYLFDSYVSQADSEGRTFLIEFPAVPGFHRVELMVHMPGAGRARGQSE